MSRSLWKNDYSELFFLKLKRKNSINKYFNYRNLLILNRHIGFFINIYNGKNYMLKRIYESDIGHKLGEFCMTTEMGSRIHLRNKKNKKKKIYKKNYEKKYNGSFS